MYSLWSEIADAQFRFIEKIMHQLFSTVGIIYVATIPSLYFSLQTHSQESGGKNL